MQEFRPLIDFTKSEPHWRDRKGRSLLTAADPIKAAPKLFLLLLLIGFFTTITFADTNCGSQPRALARTQCAMNVTSVCFPDIEMGKMFSEFSARSRNLGMGSLWMQPEEFRLPRGGTSGN